MILGVYVLLICDRMILVAGYIVRQIIAIQTSHRRNNPLDNTGFTFCTKPVHDKSLDYYVK